jgi:hypothetical protein
MLITLARKPTNGTVSAVVLQLATGVLNIGGSRIGINGGGTQCTHRDAEGRCLGHKNSVYKETFHGPQTEGGRWPANVLLTPTACATMDEQGGIRPSTMTGRLPPDAIVENPGKCLPGMFGVGGGTGLVYADSGGASRFFKQVPC